MTEDTTFRVGLPPTKFGYAIKRFGEYYYFASPDNPLYELNTLSSSSMVKVVQPERNNQ